MCSRHKPSRYGFDDDNPFFDSPFTDPDGYSLVKPVLTKSWRCWLQRLVLGFVTAADEQSLLEQGQ